MPNVPYEECCLRTGSQAKISKMFPFDGGS